MSWARISRDSPQKKTRRLGHRASVVYIIGAIPRVRRREIAPGVKTPWSANHTQPAPSPSSAIESINDLPRATNAELLTTNFNASA
jgi:hypothetical protein